MAEMLLSQLYCMDGMIDLQEACPWLFFKWLIWAIQDHRSPAIETAFAKIPLSSVTQHNWQQAAISTLKTESKGQVTTSATANTLTILSLWLDS